LSEESVSLSCSEKLEEKEIENDVIKDD